MEWATALTQIATVIGPVAALEALTIIAVWRAGAKPEPEWISGNHHREVVRLLNSANERSEKQLQEALITNRLLVEQLNRPTPQPQPRRSS